MNIKTVITFLDIFLDITLCSYFKSKNWLRKYQKKLSKV